MVAVSNARSIQNDLPAGTLSENALFVVTRFRVRACGFAPESGEKAVTPPR